MLGSVVLEYPETNRLCSPVSLSNSWRSTVPMFPPYTRLLTAGSPAPLMYCQQKCSIDATHCSRVNLQDKSSQRAL